MGTELVEPPIRQVALVRCSGGNFAKRKFEYTGPHDCVSALNIGGRGPLACEYGCLGLGTCAKVCQFDAIYLEEGVTRVNPEKCTGCLKCVAACPQGTSSRHHSVRQQRQRPVLQQGQGLLWYESLAKRAASPAGSAPKPAPTDAIFIEENLAHINYLRCIGCGNCMEKCPRTSLCTPASSPRTRIPRRGTRRKNSAQAETRDVPPAGAKPDLPRKNEPRSSQIGIFRRNGKRIRKKK